MLVLTKQQLQAFDEMMRRSFEERLLAHLRQQFPQQTARMPEPFLRSRIRQEIATAEQHGITRECEVAAYVSIAFSVSPQSPAIHLEPVREALESPDPPAQKLHHLLLLAEAKLISPESKEVN
jgi:hypothetical protein